MGFEVKKRQTQSSRTVMIWAWMESPPQTSSVRICAEANHCPEKRKHKPHLIITNHKIQNLVNISYYKLLHSVLERVRRKSNMHRVTGISSPIHRSNIYIYIYIYIYI